MCLSAELRLHSEPLAWAAAGGEGPLQWSTDAEMGPGEQPPHPLV